MSHANTSADFQEAFRRYPCGPQLCSTAESMDEGYACRPCRALRRRTVKICDSGVFTKTGCKFDYRDLFLRYENMGCDYGIIIDVLRNAQATKESAKEALEAYRELRPSFELVGVAQGRSVEQYVDCYAALKKLGYRRIAVGGMLAKRKNTSHYAYVRADQRLIPVLEALRARYPTDWLFPLGCYHPKRHLALQRLGVFGSDYKGWIFRYRKKGISTLHHARASRYGQVRSFLSTKIFNGPFYLNGATKEVGEAILEGRVLGVVSCGSRKAWSDGHVSGPVAAKDAYTGPLFRAGRAYVERFSDDWVILSGKHGLVSPESLIPRDYDARLTWRRDSAMAIELRKQVLKQGLHRFAEVVVVGGRDYVTAVSDAYAGTGISIRAVTERPMRIGRLIQALNTAVSSGVPLGGETTLVR
jgi:uncharacterized protein DUF6884